MAPRKKQTSLEELLSESKRLRERSEELTEEARTLADKIATKDRGYLGPETKPDDGEPAVRK